MPEMKGRAVDETDAGLYQRIALVLQLPPPGQQQLRLGLPVSGPDLVTQLISFGLISMSLARTILPSGTVRAGWLTRSHRSCLGGKASDRRGGPPTRVERRSQECEGIDAVQRDEHHDAVAEKSEGDV